MKLLARIAEATGWRHDNAVRVAAIDDHSEHFSDDINTLCENKSLSVTYARSETIETEAFIDIRGTDPEVSVTRQGYEALDDYNKSFLTRAIEQQPATVLQIVVNVICGVIGGLVGLGMGYYVGTKAMQNDASVVKQDANQIRNDASAVKQNDASNAPTPQESKTLPGQPSPPDSDNSAISDNDTK